ncbi:MAG TPA: acyltransferase, partial [Allosphingosinicella sp.]
MSVAAHHEGSPLRSRLTVGSRLAAAGGSTVGFDYLRLSLALAVALFHIPVFTYGSWGTSVVLEGPLRPLLMTILPMFFAAGGFLVAASLERCNTMAAFVGLRMLRLMPALAMATLFTAFVVGPALSELSLADYFKHPEFRNFFLNLFGAVQYKLPGLFTSNPIPYLVNSPLWTLPYDLLCYGGLALLGLTNLKRRPWLVPLVALGSSVTFLIVHLDDPQATSAVIGYRRGFFLVQSFLWGVSVYLFRERVPLGGTLLGIAAAVAALAVFAEGMFSYLGPPSLAYLAISIGLRNPPTLPRLKADLSYGLYLYHAIIFQALMHIAPAHWVLTAAIGLPTAFGLAALSWFV